VQTAKRLTRIPPYLFAELDRARARLEAQGVQVISLGVGDPDLPTPDYVVDRVRQAAGDPATHRYPDYQGLLAFREAVAAYYRRRFGVELDPRREVITCIGSKEGLAHLVWATTDPGDVNLVPDPAYPVYAMQTLLAGGEVHPLPLTRANGFRPRLEDVPSDVARRAKLLFLNYPNNPTGAVADLDFYRSCLEFCRDYDLWLVSDAAYVEMTYDGRHPSVLEVPGAKERAVEFYSLSKPFNMTGWRIAAMVGAADAVAALGKVKNHTDSGQWNAVQEAAVVALERAPESFIADMNTVYRRRRDLLVQGLADLGWRVDPPPATFYVWAPVPGRRSAGEFARLLLEEAHVVVVPGSGYGPAGEGYVRLCLTVSEADIEEALRRLAGLGRRLFE
jgi:LL-diaminopimelate aminotransferase